MNFPFFALGCLLILSITHADEPAAAEPLTRDDLEAGAQIDRGEVGGQASGGRYTPEQINGFLNQFVGTWEGNYAITTIDGVTLGEFFVQMTYEWEQVGDTSVLRNQSVYSAGEQLNYATMLSYHWQGRLASEVEENGVKRVYLGVISDDGKTVSWTPANTENPTRTGYRETFSAEDGEQTLKIRGYEDYQKGLKRRMLVLHGDLKQIEGPESD